MIESKAENVLDELVCSHCRQIFRSKPLKLPCGHSICSEHLDELKTGPNSIKCPFCFFKNLHTSVYPKHKLIEVKLDKEIFKKVIVHNFNKYFSIDLEKLNELEELYQNLDQELRFQFDTFIKEIENFKQKKLEFLNENFTKPLNNSYKQLVEEFSPDYFAINKENVTHVKDLLNKFENDLENYDQIDKESFDKKLAFMHKEIIKLIDKKLNTFIAPLQCYYLTSRDLNQNYNKILGSLLFDKPISKKLILTFNTGEMRLFSLNTSFFNETLKCIMRKSKLIKFFNNDLMITGESEQITIWNMKRLKRIKTISEKPEINYCKKLTVSSDNLIIYCCKQTIRIWEYLDGVFKPIGKFVPVGLLPEESIVCLKYSPKHGLFVVFDGFIQVWKIKDGFKLAQCIEQQKNFIRKIAFLDENELVTGATFGHLFIWDLESDSNLPLFRRKINYTEGFGEFKKLKVLENKNILTYVADLIALWDSELNNLLEIDQVYGPIRVLPHNLVAFTKIYSEPYAIRVWDLDKKEYVKKLKGHSGNITHMRPILNEINYLVSSSEDKTIRIWNLQTQSCVKTFKFVNTVDYFKVIE